MAVSNVAQKADGMAAVGMRRIRLLVLLTGCFMLLLLAGCGMNTEMKLDGEFKGERIITCDELEDQNNLFTKFKVSEAADVLSEKCPPQMSFECKYTNDKKTKAVFVFHLKYDSIDDYRTKVKALIGRDPSVQFTYKDPRRIFLPADFPFRRTLSPRICFRGSSRHSRRV